MLKKGVKGVVGGRRLGTARKFRQLHLLAGDRISGSFRVLDLKHSARALITATSHTMNADRRRINAPSGGTSAPVFARIAKEAGYLQSLRPQRTRGPDEPRKICKCSSAIELFSSFWGRIFLRTFYHLFSFSIKI